MAENGKGSSRKEAITIENFMTVEEINDKNRQKVRELEVLRAELNSGIFANDLNVWLVSSGRFIMLDVHLLILLFDNSFLYFSEKDWQSTLCQLVFR